MHDISHEYSDQVGLEPDPGGPVEGGQCAPPPQVPLLVRDPGDKVPVVADPVGPGHVHGGEGEGGGPGGPPGQRPRRRVGPHRVDDERRQPEVDHVVAQVPRHPWPKKIYKT